MGEEKGSAREHQAPFDFTEYIIELLGFTPAALARLEPAPEARRTGRSNYLPFLLIVIIRIGTVRCLAGVVDEIVLEVACIVPGRHRDRRKATVRKLEEIVERSEPGYKLWGEVVRKGVLLWTNAADLQPKVVFS